MKTLSLLIFLLHSLALWCDAQVVSNVKWNLEGEDKIYITYDLAKQDSYIYFDVSVKVTIDNNTITPKALSGDVGNFVKVGTGKKITWNIFEDLTELNGELSVEVVAYNPVPSDPKTVAKHTPTPPSANTPPLPTEKNVPFWVGLGSAAGAGVGLLLGGLKSTDEGKDLYSVYKDNRFEGADIYSELGTTRDDLFAEANKKYKNGTLLTIAGSAVLVGAAVIMVKRVIEVKKLNSNTVAIAPFLRISSPHANASLKPAAGLTLKIRL